ncbi:hypothetical protein [Mariniphaga anaerophila]|uniref:hypothetical protein n=1 Tax=Mariniphaga anaerophila TaxID=1484053 RepID=UPI001114D24B|nr:hypothetical protein [Mariniphaga anaerophila]
MFALFVPIYFFIAQNSLQNRHTHISAHGIVITHSHPVNHNNSEPINAHDHSKSEICFYHLVQFGYFVTAPEIHFTPQAQPLPENIFIPEEKATQQLFFCHHLTRGPPAFLNPIV